MRNTVTYESHRMSFILHACWQAPGEAEAQCAALCRANLVYATATEDMDALTFATPKLLVRFPHDVTQLISSYLGVNGVLLITFTGIL